MTRAELEWEAEALQAECGVPQGPPWGQLSDYTKQAWRDFVLAGRLARLW